MKLNLAVMKNLLVFAGSLMLLSQSAYAETSFPADAKFYTSTQFAASANVDRNLTYSSSKGTTYVFTQKGQSIKLTGLSKNAKNIFLSPKSPAKGYLNEKRLLAHESISRIEDLQEEIESVAQDIEEVQKDIKAAKAQEKKTELIDKELRPLQKQNRNLEAQIASFERDVKEMEKMHVVTIYDLFKERSTGKVLVKNGNALYLLQGKRRSVKTDNPVARRSSSANQYIYANQSYVQVGGNSVSDGGNKPLFILQVIQDTILSYEFNGVSYQLQRIEDANVKDLVSMAKQYPTSPASFGFKGDVLTTKYQWNKSSNESKTLTVEYKETGKKKNLIQVKTEAETQLYDPKTPSSSIEKHIGVLAKTKSGAVLELKKIQKTNDKVDGGWAFDYKKRLIKLGEEVLFVEKENYYGFEGLWYLAYSMASKSTPQLKVFLINGLEPISLTATLKGNKVELTKAGKVLYRFTFDNANFVTRFEFVPMKQQLNLISKDTTKTKRNRQKLNDFMQSKGIMKL